MKILNLRLKKFIGIFKGLGLDEVTIDFSALTGLVALSGQNGAGKSTVLDCCQPYSRLASRKGTLQQHTYGRDAEKELSFEFQGNTFKTLIKIDAEGSRSPEGYIWKNGVSEIDGKISNYNRYIVKLFGSPELFFASVFCSQGSKKLSDMTTGDLKKLFSEFLRLDKLIAYEDTAKQCNNLLSSRAGSLERDIESLKILTDGYAEAGALLARAKGEKAGLKQNLLELSKDLEKSEAELSTIQADIQKNELIETELAGLQDTQGRLSSEIEEDQKQSKIELDKLREKYRNFELDVVNLNSLLANETEIREAAESVETLTKTLSKDRGQLKDIGQEYFAIVGAVAKKEADIMEYHLSYVKQSSKDKRNKNALETKLDHARLKLIDLDKRDSDCVSKTCSFILSALTAQEDIPGLEILLAESVEGIAKAEKAYSNTRNCLNANMEALKGTESAQKIEKDALEAKITKTEDGLKGIKALADELSKVETALSRKQDIEKRQTENLADGKKTKDFWEKRIIEKKAQKVITETAWKKAEVKINIAAEEKVGTIEQSISNLKTSITERTDEIADKVVEIVRHEQDVAKKEQAQKELTVKTAGRELLVNEASEWLYLKNACSAKGLRALEIDSVLPAIASYANDLLIRTFGTQYTVRFQTQDEETGREVLDIIVIREDGSEVPIENLSGGQRVWLLSALRLSLTLISQEKSGKNFQTGFADESDGALDVGHAIEYVQMYRAFMEVGGFEDFLFISHKPETIALADHVLTFGNGKIAID